MRGEAWGMRWGWGRGPLVAEAEEGRLRKAMVCSSGEEKGGGNGRWGRRGEMGGEG